MDIDSIPFGIDFREHIKQALAETDILITVIGPHWLGAGKGGQSRITEETDPVRIEIETALKRGIPVIPVLVGGASMPEPPELPDTLKALSFRNAAEVDTGRDFHQHMDRLIRSMDRVLKSKYDVQSPPPGAQPPERVAPTGGTSAPARDPDASGELRRRAHGAEPAADDQLAAVSRPSAPAADGRAFIERWGVWRTGGLAMLLLLALATVRWYAHYERIDIEPKPTPQARVQVPPHPVPAASAATSTGCKLGLIPVLADDFETADPAWEFAANAVSYVDGQLSLKASANQADSSLYWPLRFKNVSVCAAIESPIHVSLLEGTASAGIIFWAIDYKNYYLVSFYPDGTYDVVRKANGVWLPSVVPRTASDQLRSGVGIVNEILVTTASDIAMVYFNGTKIAEFRGQPPKEASMVGLFASSEKAEANDWRFVNVAASDPEQPQQQDAPAPAAPRVAPECKPRGRATFEDNFKPPKPGWEVDAEGRAYFEENQLVIKPKPDARWFTLHPWLASSATICTHVKSPSQLSHPYNAGSGGVVFWALNVNNVYVAEIFTDGQFAIYRLYNGWWARIVPKTNAESIKQGPGAINELIVWVGKDVASFYINNVKVWEFVGQPPPNGGTIGLYAESGAAQSNEWRFLDVLVVDNEGG